jgi:hypothetical protein
MDYLLKKMDNLVILMQVCRYTARNTISVDVSSYY